MRDRVAAVVVAIVPFLGFGLVGCAGSDDASQEESSIDMPRRGEASSGDDQTTPATNTDPGANTGAASGRDSRGAAPGGAVAPTTPACDPNKPFDAPVMVSAFREVGVDTSSVRLSSNMLTAYLTRPAGIYTSTRATTSAPWSAPSLMTSAGGSWPGLHATLTSDSLTMYVQQGLPVGGSDVMMATRPNVASAFGALVAVPGINDPSVEDLAPYVSDDGNAIYFSSRRLPNIASDPNIYRAEKRAGVFGTPVLVPGVNTGGYDSFPVPSSDELTIYFASDQSGGGFDIFTAHRASTSYAFPKPQVVTELSSTAAEFPSYVTHDGCSIYFSSNRTGNNLDIYVASRPL